ncbi:MAG: glycosyltransferase family 4 protein [Terriglobia bacterium]
MVETARSKGRIAWCISPVLSGVTTVYQVVGGGLRRRGWEVLGVTAGGDASAKVDSRFAGDDLEVLAAGNPNVCAAAAEFVRWVGERNIDLVFCAEQMFALAAAPALPVRVKLVTRSGTITRRSYALAAAHLSRTSKIIVETPRQQSDLIRDWGVPPEKCAVIPGGVEIETFTPGAVRDFQGSLRLVFLGRLDENQKAVMMLSPIARRLATSGVEFHLDIVGEGGDGDRLRAAFGSANLADHVTFHGYLPRTESIPILQHAHMLLLPSRYEGHSWALLEAMACGCVPVVSRIAGGTDFVVEHGVNGMLCPVGSVADFSSEVERLSTDRKKLENLSAAACGTIRDRFSIDRVVREHDLVFQEVLDQDPIEYTPIPVSEIQLPKLPGAGWRKLLPQGVKNYVRTWAERFERSV